jgi:hypothetical protein
VNLTWLFGKNRKKSIDAAKSERIASGVVANPVAKTRLEIEKGSRGPQLLVRFDPKTLLKITDNES